jgi:hypothetical protein
VVACPGGDANERKPTRCGDCCHDRQGAIATCHPQRVRATCDRLVDERCQVWLGSSVTASIPRSRASCAIPARAAAPAPDRGLTNSTGRLGGETGRHPYRIGPSWVWLIKGIRWQTIVASQLPTFRTLGPLYRQQRRCGARTGRITPAQSVGPRYTQRCVRYGISRTRALSMRCCRSSIYRTKRCGGHSPAEASQQPPPWLFQCPLSGWHRPPVARPVRRPHAA